MPETVWVVRQLPATGMRDNGMQLLATGRRDNGMQLPATGRHDNVNAIASNWQV